MLCAAWQAWVAAGADPVGWAVWMVLVFLYGVAAVWLLAVRFDRESSDRFGGGS